MDYLSNGNEWNGTSWFIGVVNDSVISTNSSSYAITYGTVSTGSNGIAPISGLVFPDSYEDLFGQDKFWTGNPINFNGIGSPKIKPFAITVYKRATGSEAYGGGPPIYNYWKPYAGAINDDFTVNKITITLPSYKQLDINNFQVLQGIYAPLSKDADIQYVNFNPPYYTNYAVSAEIVYKGKTGQINSFFTLTRQGFQYANINLPVPTPTLPIDDIGTYSVTPVSRLLTPDDTRKEIKIYNKNSDIVWYNDQSTGVSVEFKNFGSTDNSAINIAYGPRTLVSNKTKYFRQTVSVDNSISQSAVTGVTYSSHKTGWASYYVASGSGMNNGSNNLFAYSFDIVKQYSSPTEIVTIEQNNQIISGKSPEIYTSTGNVLSDLIYISGFDCNAEVPNFIDEIVCWSGKNTTDDEYKKFVSGVFRGHQSSIVPEFNNNTSNLTSVSGNADFSQFFTYKSGYIKYNNFITGDAVVFNLYGFDYFNTYRRYHLSNQPSFPQTGFVIYYGKDFNDPQSLADKLNAKLRDVNYPVWYPYDKLKGTEIGIYITGSLMSFDLQEDSNIINFKTNRNYISGFNLDLVTVNRPVIDTKKFNGYSYLMPDTVELQGKINNNWVTLDKRTGVFDQYSYLAEKELPVLNKNYIQDNNALLNSGIPYVNLDGESSVVILDNLTQQSQPTGTFVELFQFQQTKFVQAGKYCAPIPYSRTVYVKQPSGWPDGYLSGCVPPSGSGSGDCDVCCQYAKDNNLGESGIYLYSEYQVQDPEFSACKGDNAQLVPYVMINNTVCYRCISSSGDSSNLQQSGSIKYYRTGWHIDQSDYLSSIGINNISGVLNLSCTEYRVLLSDFYGQTDSAENISLIKSNKFVVNGINLFGAKPENLNSYLVSGGGDPIINCAYNLDVQGYVPYKFNTNYNYSVTRQSNSGIYNAINEAIIYTPSSNERNIKFINSSGRMVGDVTGLLNRMFYASGNISKTYDDYYFYDPSNNIISLTKTLTGYSASGKGKQLTGESNVLTNKAVNAKIVIGGLLNGQSYYTKISGSGNVVGKIPNILYQKDDVVGVYNLAGNITGYSQGGAFNYNQNISGYFDGNNSNAPYYPQITGQSNASSIIYISENNLLDYDYLAINSNPITYLAAGGSQYFTNTDGLISLINSSPNLYSVRATNLGSNGGLSTVLIDSLISGQSGNNITLQTNNTSGIILDGGNLTGGADYYPSLFNFGIFSSNISGTAYQTGFYTSDLGVGTITGGISSFVGTRSFEKIWEISTGLNNILSPMTRDNMVSATQFFSLLSGDTDIGNYYNFIKMAVKYYNQFPLLSNNVNDVIEITVTGYNFPAPTGITFKITGLK